jgi:hypothetical protein
VFKTLDSGNHSSSNVTTSLFLETEYTNTASIRFERINITEKHRNGHTFLFRFGNSKVSSE